MSQCLKLVDCSGKSKFSHAKDLSFHPAPKSLIFRLILKLFSQNTRKLYDDLRIHVLE
jgi:hypothetical protein